jgi:pyruvate kinase
VTKKFNDTDDMFYEAIKVVMKAGFAKKGDRIVLTAGVPMGESGTTTLLRVLEC